MKNFIWRTKARTVAYVALVLSVYFLMCTTLSIFQLKLIDYAPPPSRVENCRIWLIIAFGALTSGLHFWASLKLLSATEFGRDVNEALEKARVWRNVTLALLVMVVLSAVFRVFTVLQHVAVGGWDWGKYLSTWATLEIILWMLATIFMIWCGISLFNVYRYMKELETALPSGGTASGDVSLEWICCGGACIWIDDEVGGLVKN